MDENEAFVLRKRFRWNKIECGWPLGVSTCEEAWKLRLVMKSENVRENRGFHGKLYFLINLSELKRFSTNKHQPPAQTISAGPNSALYCFSISLLISRQAGERTLT